jgi:hypothetical protein
METFICYQGIIVFRNGLPAEWTTVAGGNGLGIKANQQSTGSFVDTYGNIFVADYGNHRIQKNMPQIIIKAGETGSTYN